MIITQQQINGKSKLDFLPDSSEIIFSYQHSENEMDEFTFEFDYPEQAIRFFETCITALKAKSSE